MAASGRSVTDNDQTARVPLEGRWPASSGRSGAETLPSGSTGVKVEQPQLAVADMAMQPQKQPSTIDDTRQHEELLEGPLASESN